MAAKSDVEADLPPLHAVLPVMISVIQGYTLIGPLQHSFKEAMNVGDTGALGHAFTQAAALVQWGKFAMTMGQNLVLAPCSPLVRVYIAMAGMFLGALIPPFCVFALESHWFGWVFLSFGLIGLSLGVFECTFLNVITPLGPLTKSWAIMGFPAAFFLINVLGFLLVSFGMPVQVLFWYVVACMPFGAALFAFRVVPRLREVWSESAGRAARADGEAGGKGAAIWDSCLDWRAWLPSLLPFMLCNIVGHFVMEGALPANFNAFNDHVVPLLGRTDDHLMNKERFFVVFFVFVGVGDMASRRFTYSLGLDTYRSSIIALLAALACCLAGMYLTTLGIGVVAWLSAFLSFWGQGMNYAIGSKYIDRFVPRRHNLAAYSLWIFTGAAGAILGSTLVDVIRYWICHDEASLHECLAH